MADADDLTRNPDGSVTAMTWAATGVATEPALGVKNAGYVAATAPSDAQWNWAQNAGMDWHRAMFQRYPDASRLMFSSWLSLHGVWSTTGVAAFNAFLSDVAGVNSLVADVWTNPPSVDTGAVQVQVQVTKAIPHVFTAFMDTYVYVPNEMITPPTVTEAELTYIEVINLGLQPATPAGTVPTWKVVTDGVGVTGATVLLPEFPIMKQIGFEIVSAGEIMVQGDVEIGGTLEVDGNTTIGGTLDVDGNMTLGDAPGDVHTVNGSMTGTGTRVSGAITAPSIEATGATPVVLGGGATVAAGKSVIGDVSTPLTMGLVTVLDKVVTTGGIEGAASAAVTLNEGAVVPTGKTLTLDGTAQIAGGVGTGVTAQTILCESVQLDVALWQSDVTLPTVAGEVRFNESHWSLMDGAGQVHTFAEPTRGIDVVYSTPNAMNDTTASCMRRIKHTEPVWLTMSCRFEGTLALSNMLYRIQVTGPLGNADIINDLAAIDVVNKGYYLHETVRWIPTDDFLAIDIQDYTFLARIGVSGGTVTCARVAITAVSDFLV